MRKVFAGDQGSYTLEAAVVLPVFLAVMLLLVNFIKIAMVYVAMDHAVGETARQIAAWAYPLQYLQTTGQTGPQVSALPGIQGDPGLPTTSDVLVAVGNRIKETGAEYLTEQVAQEAAMRLIHGYLPEHIYPAGMEMTRLKIYNPNRTSAEPMDLDGIPLANQDIAIVVDYRVKLALPLSPQREVTLSAVAVERAWVSDLVKGR